MKPLKRHSIVIPALLSFCAHPLSAAGDVTVVELATVVSKPVSRTIDLPGEIAPFLSVSLHAKVAGYVERVHVDRGSVVKEGQLLIELTAPELQAQIAEAESKVQAAESDRLQAVAQLAAAQSTLDRLKEASATPGAVAGNDLVMAQKQTDAAQALVNSRQQTTRAATAVVDAQKQLQAYLRIAAPFDGVVTERLVHPGALVGPNADEGLLVIQQVSHLRVIVPVPEENVGAIVQGASVSFRVPAFPGRTYSGSVARLSHALDQATRTMAVELDFFNRDGSLSPGMYPTIKWPVRSAHPAILVPVNSIVTTTERTFVVRDQGGHAQWVDVKKIAADGDLVEVLGDLQPGDRVVRRATDELREGIALQARASATR